MAEAIVFDNKFVNHLSESAKSGRRETQSRDYVPAWS